MSFWNTLPKPFHALAPMEDVTDAAFRALFARYGKPDVMWTEFTSADGLVRADQMGLKRLRRKLLYTEGERPIVVQLFSSNPEYMETAARMCKDLGFDGIDINMGCPDRAVERQLCGSGMIRHPDLAAEIIAAAQRGAGDVPVSVKTRIGYTTDEIDTWIAHLLKQNIAALTVHMRTRNELSDVAAHWDLIPRIIALRDSIAPRTRVIGNGDVQSIAQGNELCAQYGCDGVMYGRGIFGNPQFFAGVDKHTRSELDSIRLLTEHIHLFQQTLSGYVSEAVMKRHFKAYITGWHGAAELRTQLMDTHTLEEAPHILENYHSAI